MKSFLFICVLNILWVATTKAADTLHIISHHNVTVVTDPSTGGKSYKRWVVFPSAKTGIRKINLNVIFGCPDSLRCADWDYLDHIYIRRVGGVNGPSADDEIGHMLTPYGGAFSKSWSFPWQVDITDFRPLLNDSVEIEYFHSGYEPNNDRGWRITIDFEMILGKPVLKPIAIHKIYDGAFRYGDSAHSIEQDLKPVTVTTNQRTGLVRLFIYQTGHGSDSNECGEFCSRYREIWFDGKLIDKRNIWKKCGDNPLYPQAGTWLSDRAYWCPGELQQPDVFDIPVKGRQPYVFDINMEPYVTPKPSAAEVICAYLIEYEKPAAGQDVSMEDILAPTDKPIYLRKNPSAMNPMVVIQNKSAKSLSSVKISYGTKGFPVQQFLWKGNLGFNEKAIISLPGLIEGHPGENIFTAVVSSPNGKNDAYPDDNSLKVAFSRVPVHEKELILHLLTNNEPEHNAYTLRNGEGQIVYERKLGSLKANTNYRDTLHLVPGHYAFSLVDTAGDGLEFWYNTKGGRGICRLLNGQGQLLKNFDSDFGNGIYYSFEVGDKSADWAKPITTPAVGLFPTRTHGKTTLDYFSNEAKKVTIRMVTDPGNEVAEEHVYDSLKEALIPFDLSYRAPQRYYVKVFVGDTLVFNKRLRVEGRPKHADK